MVRKNPKAKLKGRKQNRTEAVLSLDYFETGLLGKFNFENISYLLILAALCFLFFRGLFQFGLFFPRDLLPFHAYSFGVFSVWVMIKIVRRDFLLLKTPIDFFMILFLLSYFSSLFVAVHLRQALAEFFKVANYLAVYFIIVDLLGRGNLLKLSKKESKQSDETKPGPAGNDPVALSVLLHLILLSGLIVAVTGLGAAAGTWNQPDYFFDGRIATSLGYYNTGAAYIMMTFFLAFGLAIICNKQLLKPLYLMLAAPLIIPFIFTYSRGAWLVMPLVAVIFFIVSLPADRLRFLLYLAVGVTVPGVFIIYINRALSAQQSSQTWFYIGFIALTSLLGGYLVELFLKQSRFRQRVFATVLVIFVVIAIFFVVYQLDTRIEPDNFNLNSIINVLPDTLYSGIFSRESSMALRFEHYNDALKIIRDYPIFGIGAGGWAALYKSYQVIDYPTTEVHNHYLQVWIDSGILGFLSFMAIWITAIASFIWVRFNSNIDNQKIKKLRTAIMMPLIALLLHSAIDFNLSYGLVSIALFCLLGSFSVTDRLLDDGAGNLYGLWKRRVVIKSYYQKIQLPLLIGLLVTALLIALLSTFFYSGGITAEKAVQAGKVGNLKSAEALFLEAAEYDPFEASNHLNLSRIYRISSSPRLVPKALEHAALAVRLEPYNPLYLQEYGLAKLQFAELDEAFTYLNRAVDLRPRDPEAYRLVAQYRIAVAEYYQEQNEPDLVNQHLEALPLLSAKLKEKIGSSEALNYYLGRAAQLQGNLDHAILYYQAVIEADSLYPEAKKQLEILGNR